MKPLYCNTVYEASILYTLLLSWEWEYVFTHILKPLLDIYFYHAILALFLYRSANYFHCKESWTCILSIFLAKPHWIKLWSQEGPICLYVTQLISGECDCIIFLLVCKSESWQLITFLFVSDYLSIPDDLLLPICRQMCSNPGLTCVTLHG